MTPKDILENIVNNNKEYKNILVQKQESSLVNFFKEKYQSTNVLSSEDLLLMAKLTHITKSKQYV